MTTAEILMAKFGAKGCISRAKAICDQKYGDMLRFERVHGEYLKSHCDPKYAAYKDGDATVRSGICLGEFKYAEDAIVAAALTMYIEAMGKHESLRSENVRLKSQMDEAAYYINVLLSEIPTNPKPHNWLIRNGYQDTSYQADIYGQQLIPLPREK